jgi:tryptophan-rich sensory protein
MTPALWYSLGLCVAGAVLEGLFAGRGVRQRLAKLRWPPYAIAFWGWMVVGALYYLICFAVAYRLFNLPTASARNTSLALLGGVMFINALWNCFFFRRRNLRQAYLLGIVYTAVACALFAMLLKVDGTAAWCFLPYVLYLNYANFWGRQLVKLNTAR